MSSKGFSIVEALIAIGVISAVAYLVSHFSTYYVSQDVGLRRLCEAHAEAIIASVQEETYYRAIGNYVPDSAGRTPPANIFTGTTAVPTANLGDYWEAANTDDEISQNGSNAISSRLHNSFLIQGSLRTLMAIYNRTPGIRCGYAAYGPLTGRNLPGLLNQINNTNPVVTTVQLQPYYRSGPNAGVVACPPVAGMPLPSLYAAPRGLSGDQTNNPDQDAFAPNSGLYTTTAGHGKNGIGDTLANMNPPAAAASAIARSTLTNSGDMGMIMTVRVQYTWEGQNLSCSANQKFEYPIDQNPPARPDVAEVLSNNSYSGAFGIMRDYCSGVAPTNAVVQLRMGYTSNIEGGVQLFCKDLSFMRNRAAGVLPNIPCVGGAGPGQFLDPDPAYFPNSTTRDHQFSFIADFTQRADYWQPCDRLTQCGQTPDVVGASPLNALPMLTLTYNDIPNGCSLNFEVVGVDTAGNRSGIRTNAGTKRFLFNNAGVNTTSSAPTYLAWGRDFVAREDEVYFPVCGRTAGPNYRSGLGYYCGAGIPGFPWAGFPNGYYTCGGSC